MDAVTVCLQKVIHHPHDPELQFELATLYFKEEQYAQSLTHFIRCTECTRDPTLISECLLSGSKVMCKQGDRSSKEYGLILHSLSIGTKNPEPYYTKSLYHSWRGEWMECYTVTCLALSTLDSFEPTFRNTELFSYNGYIDLICQKALSAYRKGKYDEAREIYNDVLNRSDITQATRNSISDRLRQVPLPSNPIPKKIFQTWETSKHEISAQLQCYIDSWGKNNPDYELHFYNKSERYEFIKKHFDATVLDAYTRLKPGAFKCDLWRYCVLYIHGGFYADIDSLCCSSLNIINTRGVKFTCPIDLPPAASVFSLSNGFIGSIPKHPILRQCIDAIVCVVNSTPENHEVPVHTITGTGRLGISMNEYMGLPWDSSFIGKEGISHDINLLEFKDRDTEYMIDTVTGAKIVQNKNGHIGIKTAYEAECSKFNTFFDWGKFGQVTSIGNIVSYDPFERSMTKTELPNYHGGTSASFYLFKNCGISDCIRRGCVWEQHQHDIIDKYLDSNSVAVEIGAHIGTITVKLSKVVSKVYAFEPMKATYNILVDNLKLNNCDNVMVYEKGCGDENKTEKVKWVSTSNAGGTGLEGGYLTKDSNLDYDIMVDVITLDSLEFKTIDYMKIDVEGYEELVITGARETIKTCLPLIIVECFNKDTFNSHIFNAPRATDSEIEERFKFLLDLGYTYEHVAFEDFLFIPPL